MKKPVAGDQSAPPAVAAPKCMVKEDFGPWKIVDDNNETTLYSNDFEHAVVISINGYFANAAQRIAYAENVVKKLSAPNGSF